MNAARLFATLLFVFALVGCTQISSPEIEPWPKKSFELAPSTNLDNSCIADFKEGIDYFPDKTSFSYSEQLTVEYAPYFKRVRFKPTIATGEELEFLLVQCGAPIPPHDSHTPVIQIPIQRLVTGNSSLLRALDELGLVDRLYGTENVRSATVPAVRERIAEGKINDMWGYGHANIEQIMAVKADVYLSFYSAYPQGNMHPRLWELGVRAIPQADHHEKHPLGRAEWLKLLALLSNREKLANAQFDAIQSRYQALLESVKDLSTKPVVLYGYAASRDSFETFGGDNQSAQLIRDAGGTPSFLDGGPSSLVYLPFEKALFDGARADVWLGTLGGQTDVDALVQTNRLHGLFDAVRTQKVYAWDRDYTGAWAYPYQDQSMTLPHVLLEEAISVLHPASQSPVNQPQFLRKLP